MQMRTESVIILLAIIPLAIMTFPALALIAPTDGGVLDVEFTHSPQVINPGDEARLHIDFKNPQTQDTQIHIDYYVTVLEDQKEVFGPTGRIHTSEGKASIPIQFQRDGQYTLRIDVDGILFNSIPMETVYFPVYVGRTVPETEMPDADNGCLVATATFGSELAGQVQMLREIRDESLLSTQSGSAFMSGFNAAYYWFSPSIADWERQNPAFREYVKLAITPLIWSLSILNHVDMDTEEKVLAYGIGVISLNIGMYVGLPVAAIVKLLHICKTRNGI